MKNLLKYTQIIILSLFLFQCSNDDDVQPQPETVTDADGNVYSTVTIGNQIWMSENLKTTKYNDGTPITLYTFAMHGNNWGSLNNMEEFYQWPDTNDLNNVVDEELAFDAYGAMYNYFAIESGKLAPTGWRIPTAADFMELENFVGNDGNTGNEATVLKSETGWFASSGNGTNEYGFNAIPNGYINAFGGPTLANGTSTLATTNLTGVSLGSQTRTMVSFFQNGEILYDENAIQIGAGVRCIKIQ